MRAHALPALILLAALTACGGKKDEGPERKTAAGEVLGGSISDAMLPLATVTSQSPPLREIPADNGDKTADSADKTANSADDAEATSDVAASTEPSAAASASAAPQAED
jgi:hypothetical protein